MSHNIHYIPLTWQAKPNTVSRLLKFLFVFIVLFLLSYYLVWATSDDNTSEPGKEQFNIEKEEANAIQHSPASNQNSDVNELAAESLGMRQGDILEEITTTEISQPTIRIYENSDELTTAFFITDATPVIIDNSHSFVPSFVNGPEQLEIEKQEEDKIEMGIRNGENTDESDASKETSTSPQIEYGYVRKHFLESQNEAESEKIEAKNEEPNDTETDIQKPENSNMQNAEIGYTHAATDTTGETIVEGTFTDNEADEPDREQTSGNAVDTRNRESLNSNNDHQDKSIMEATEIGESKTPSDDEGSEGETIKDNERSEFEKQTEHSTSWQSESVGNKELAHDEQQEDENKPEITEKLDEGIAESETSKENNEDSMGLEKRKMELKTLHEQYENSGKDRKPSIIADEISINSEAIKENTENTETNESEISPQTSGINSIEQARPNYMEESTTESLLSCPIEEWNNINTDQASYQSFLKQLFGTETLKNGGSAEAEEGLPQILAAFAYKDLIAVTLSARQFSSESVYCRYYDCHKSEMEHHREVSSVLFNYTVFCPRRAGAKYISISETVDRQPQSSAQIVQRLRSKHLFTVCVSLDEQNDNTLQLAKFIEYYKLHGSSLFYVYIKNISEKQKILLDDYKRTKDIQVIKVGTSISDKALENDCLHRNKYFSKWSTFLNLSDKLEPNVKDAIIATYLASNTNFKTNVLKYTSLESKDFTRVIIRPEKIASTNYRAVYEYFGDQGSDSEETHGILKQFLTSSNQALGNFLEAETPFREDFIDNVNARLEQVQKASATEVGDN